MAYYIISFEPESMGKFQERFEFLKDAHWINEIKFIKQLLPSGEMSYFLVSFGSFNPEIDNCVMSIKQQLSDSKIIYIYDSKSECEIENHKNSPFAGDLYVNIEVDQETFFNQLESIGLTAVELAGNKLDKALPGMVKIMDEKDLGVFKNHPISNELNKYLDQEIFKKQANFQSTVNFKEPVLGVDMSDKDQDLSLEDLGELEISDEAPSQSLKEEEGLELSLDEGSNLDISDEVPESLIEDEGLTLDAIDLPEKESDSSEIEDLNFSSDINEEVGDLNLSDGSDEVSLSDPENNDQSLIDSNEDELNNIFSQEIEDQNADNLQSASDLNQSGDELSDDALEKLKEIDEIMVLDASQSSMQYSPGDLDQGDQNSLELKAEKEVAADIDQPLVSDDLNLDSIDFPFDESSPTEEVKEIKRKKPREEIVQQTSSSMASGRSLNQELKEISGAYSGEMERLQATISNLREDREELLSKIQKLEEEKVLYSRHNLSLRAELDEKKIELSIVRKKLNEDISDLKDKLKIQDEKKLIQDERMKQIKAELDKVDQKNKLDIRKVQMREKELEQKLELLKSDAETQIRNRDLKILELKRKIDTMEFDMESISTQEKRSVESRFELEDKLDKAIKTLRSAISVLEDESDKNSALEALKKNIEM